MLLILLATIGYGGVGYALASGQVRLGQGMSTSTVSLAWFYRSCDTLSAGQESATWSVVRTTSTLLTVAIDNMYPGFTLACDAHFTNVGSVPFGIASFSITNSLSGALPLAIDEDPDDPGQVGRPCMTAQNRGTTPSTVGAHDRRYVRFSITVVASFLAVATFSFQVVIKQRS